MGEQGSLTAIAKAEYESIEAAVMETARGRWFLAEFALRNRTADTTMLLAAIGRLEQAVTGERAVQSMDRVRFDLMEMAKAIARTKSEIAAIQAPEHEQSRLMEASESLDGIVRMTERATSDILEAAEHVQEAAWTLREKGADEELCGELDRRATDIYTACSFQDITAQRTGKIVHALRYLEGRINAMMDIWGADDEPVLESAPPPNRAPGPQLSQGDVDTVIIDDELFSAQPHGKAALALRPEAAGLFVEADDLGFIEIAPAPAPTQTPVELPLTVTAADDLAPAPALPPPSPPPAAAAKLIIVEPPAAPPPPPMSRLDAFAEIEGLDTREKLRRFT
jgi:chemotaxis regulatin CheY-phosphate phosphatase CheZ